MGFTFQELVESFCGLSPPEEVKNTWIVPPMVLWLRQVISKPRHVWCYGEGDIVKSSKWLEVVKIYRVVGCVSGNLINLGED